MNNDFSNWSNSGYYGSNSTPQMSNFNPENPIGDSQNPNPPPQNPNPPPQNPNFHPQIPNFQAQNPNFVPQNPNFHPQQYPTHQMNLMGIPFGYHSNFFQGYQQVQPMPIPSSNSSRKSSVDGGGTDQSQETPTSGKNSAVPRFSSPQGLEAINLNFDPQSDDENDDMKCKKIPFTEKECEYLAKCWIDTSIDSIVGNGQKSDQLWERITSVYNKGKGRPKDSPERSFSSVKTLFFKLSRESKWFNSYFCRIAQMWGSGLCEADIIDRAQEEYIKHHGGRGFKHIGTWRLLKDCPKFAEQDSEVRASKKGKSSASGAYTSASNPDDDDDEPIRKRPIGNKAAKRKAMKGKEKSTSEAKEVADAINARAAATVMMAKAMNEKAKAMNEKQKAREYKILMQDTSNMSAIQLQHHLQYCAQIQKKWAAEENDD